MTESTSKLVRPVEYRGRVVSKEIRTKATPQQVYAAWADPEKIAHWFCDRAEGVAAVGAPIVWIFDEFNLHIPYKVLRAQPGEAFTITWEPPPGADPGILDVTISRESGETVVRLVNSGFREGAEWEDEFEGVVSGWEMALALMKHYLENYFGSARTSFLAMHPAQFTYEQVLAFHRTPEGLAKWLTTRGSIGGVGEAFQLTLRGGEPVSGRVLAITKREVALSWDQIRGALELKALAMGPQRTLCVRGCGWGMSREGARQIKDQMDQALERLARGLETHARPTAD